jgi:uncharacterized membrane protein
MSQSEQNALSFERIVFFSDAVFAIVITLLVLEIKVPHLERFSEGALNDALLHMIPKFIGFLASFLIIGLMWFEHHRLFRYIKDFDAGLIWRNLFFLLSISFIPFPTALSSEYFASRTAFIFYAGSFALAGLTKLWLWHYASSKSELLAENTTNDLILRIKRRSWAVPIGATIAALLSFVTVFIAPFGFALIPVIARFLDPARKAESIDAEEAEAVSEIAR